MTTAIETAVGTIADAASATGLIASDPLVVLGSIFIIVAYV